MIGKVAYANIGPISDLLKTYIGNAIFKKEFFLKSENDLLKEAEIKPLTAPTTVDVASVGETIAPTPADKPAEGK